MLLPDDWSFPDAKGRGVMFLEVTPVSFLSRGNLNP